MFLIPMPLFSCPEGGEDRGFDAGNVWVDCRVGEVRTSLNSVGGGANGRDKRGGGRNKRSEGANGVSQFAQLASGTVAKARSMSHDRHILQRALMSITAVPTHLRCSRLYA